MNAPKSTFNSTEVVFPHADNFIWLRTERALFFLIVSNPFVVGLSECLIRITIGVLSAALAHYRERSALQE